MDTEIEAQPSAAVVLANFRHFVGDILWFGLAMPATARFLSVYAIRLGAEPMLLGWLAALPAILALASSSLAAWWRRRYPDTVGAQLWPGVFYRFVFLLPALTPFFPAEWQPVWLVLAVSLPALPQGISSVMFLVLLREGMDSVKLTALMSRRSLIFNIAVALSTLAFGFWLEEVAFPFNYQSMYVVAFALSLVSAWHVQKVRILTVEEQPVTTPDQPVVSPWRSPAFQGVAVIVVIMHVSFYMLIPIIPLRLVDELGATEGFMSIFALAELGAAALVAALTNRIVGRIGSRPAIGLGLAGTGLAAIVLALTSNLYVTLPAAAISGGMWTLAAISLFNYFSECTPRESLTSYSTLYNQIVMLSVFVGPMLGSQLASMSLELTSVLMIGAVLRLIAGGLIPSNIRRGRMKRTAHPAPAAKGYE
jgi:MFS family permease